MRADSALSHLQDGELCIARTRHGEEEVQWNKRDWRFYYARRPAPQICEFDEIEEWRPASIRYTPHH